MKHIVIYIIAFFLMTNTALGQGRYRIEKANCSFILPETWEFVSERVSNPSKSTLIITLFIDKTIPTRKPFILSGHEYNVYIENMISPKRPEAKTEKRFLSIMADEKQEVLDGRIEFMFKQGYGIPKKWKGADFIDADLYYDQDRHVKIETIEMYKANVGRLTSVTAIFLGSSRETIFNFLWEGENSESFFDSTYTVIDSFEYDQGHGFGEGKNKLVSEAVLSGSVSQASGVREKAMAFIVNALIFAVCLWLGMKITDEEGSFMMLIFISAVSSLVGLVPVAGWILSAVVMYILICKMMEIEFFPDAVIMVVVANIIAMLVDFAFIAKLVGT